MLDQFIQSRIDYVIENTLGYVELDIFLDHMNEKNKNTKIHELNDLFESIFKHHDLETVKLTGTTTGEDSKSKKCQIVDGTGLIEEILYVEDRFRKITNQINPTTGP